MLTKILLRRHASDCGNRSKSNADRVFFHEGGEQLTEAERNTER